MNPKTGWDIWALPLGGDGKSVPVIQTDADERTARLSPDGRWVAFVANTSGVFEVYVQPFPGPGRRLQVSTKGGDRRNGGRMVRSCFISRSMENSRRRQSNRQRITNPSMSVHHSLSLSPKSVASLSVRANYAPSVDGQRFLVNRLLRDAGGTPLRVVLNWSAGQ